MGDEKKVYAYDPAGEYRGYVRLDTDEVGQLIGEVYSNQAVKLGAVRFDPMKAQNSMSRVFDPEGHELGYVRLERHPEDKLGGDIYWSRQPGRENKIYAHVLYNTHKERAEIHKKAEWGEKLGSLRPENVSNDELVLIGGGAALLILL